MQVGIMIFEIEVIIVFVGGLVGEVICFVNFDGFKFYVDFV